ncbi:MAG: hypothetical protein [Wendovervirus sonii]|uniref:Baseplate hub subunit n=1 Tax=phage Lak_Megaphage_Sonny TaxID=3109229 RepID=A0ABZ0Z314_9CAUD|nr:MAG: hypothetical protein [phage Lak_Megaphage_Sonny]
MYLKLKSTGPTNNFVQWLKGFKDIDPLQSIIIEVDLNELSFIAKCFPDNKSVIKYSTISFEDAGYELAYIKDGAQVDMDWNNCSDETDKRIKIGLYHNLGKVIDVVTMFSETEHEMDINFDLNKAVKYKPDSRGNAIICPEYTGIIWSFISKALKMNIHCSQLSELFQKLDDNKFLNGICNIGSPSVYEVKMSTLNNLAKISSALSTDKSKDKIKFYSKLIDGNRAFFAEDATNGTYDYLIGYYSSGENGDTATTVFKENFINATKGLNVETLELILDTAGASRIIINVNNAKIVIGAIKQ